MTLVIALIALLLIREYIAYKDRRKAADERTELLRTASLERKELLNRIQAPETVIAQEFQPSSLKQFASFDDDSEFWAAKEDVNGTG